MQPDVWMPVYIGDYLGDTMHLTTEQHGAYLLLLMHYWRKGPLPANPALLASIAKLSGDAWSNAWAMLEQFFCIANDGLLHNKRADEEIAKAQKNRKTLHERAEKAAKKRWDKRADAPSNAPSNAQAMLDRCPSPSPKPSQERTKENPPLPLPKPGGLDSPAAGPPVPHTDSLDATDVARAVVAEISISDHRAYAAIRSQAEIRLNAGEDADTLRARMVDAWRQYQASKGSLSYAPGCAHFFEQWDWDDESRWPWRIQAPNPTVAEREQIAAVFAAYCTSTGRDPANYPLTDERTDRGVARLRYLAQRYDNPAEALTVALAGLRQRNRNRKPEAVADDWSDHLMRSDELIDKLIHAADRRTA